jgi:hypothetical protein
MVVIINIIIIPSSNFLKKFLMFLVASSNPSRRSSGMLLNDIGHALAPVSIQSIPVATFILDLRRNNYLRPVSFYIQKNSKLSQTLNF